MKNNTIVNTYAMNYEELKKAHIDAVGSGNTALAESLKVQMGFEFEDIFYHFKSTITSMVSKAVLEATSNGLSISSNDFESAYYKALQEAVDGYNGKSNLVQRFHFFGKRRKDDVFRKYQVIREGQKEYIKARNRSFEEPIGNDGLTLGDKVDSDYATISAEAEALGGSLVELAVVEYRKINAKYAEIIGLLSIGTPIEEVAQLIGEKENNGKVRAIVFRARKSFAKYLQEQHGMTV